MKQTTELKIKPNRFSKFRQWLGGAREGAGQQKLSVVDPNATVSLMRLPEDLVFNLLRFLTLEDAVSLSQVCRMLHYHSSSYHYWYIVLRTDTGRTPLAYPAFTDLSTLPSKNLRRLAVRAACIRRTILQSGSILRLWHLDSFNLPSHFHFICPPIPGTRLIVLCTGTQVEIWDYITKCRTQSLTLGDPFWHHGQPVECHRVATDFVQVPGACLFAIWSTRPTTQTGTELVVVRVQHDTVPVQVGIVRSIVVPWQLGHFLGRTVAFNTTILVVLTKFRWHISFFVFSMSDESTEHRLIRTDISFEGLRNVSFNAIGDQFVLLVANDSHLRVYRFSTSDLESPSAQELLILSPTKSSPRTLLHSRHIHPNWPIHFLSSQTQSFVEVMTNEEKMCLTLLHPATENVSAVIKEPPFSLNATLTSSASGTTFLLHQRWLPHLFILQCDPVEGVTSLHRLVLPYGGRSRFKRYFSANNKLDWTFAIDDAHGEVLMINDKTFFRLSYI